MYIAVNPVGSKFAKALQAGLASVNIKSLRCSVNNGQKHAARGRKVFFITQQPLDKVEQLTRFKANGVSCPEFVFSADDVPSMESRTIVARTLTNSTGGKGIVLFEKQDGVPVRCSLYTGYVPKKAEYRVHVMGGRVIDVQQKRRRADVEGNDGNTRIRNLANGFVYTRDNVTPPENIGDLAVKAVAALGYQYGAVDIVYNEKRNMCYVLEVNSRPGLQGTTISRYAAAVKALYD